MNGNVDPLHRLCPQLGSSVELAIVVAHPDDEVIGAGGHLPNWQQTSVVHVTDGAPLNMADARGSGYARREDYARARGEEVAAALALAQIPSRQIQRLDFIDQQTAGQLEAIVPKLLDLLERLSPAAVLTHPYEGGHADHDSTAFAVHLACRHLWRGPQPPPTIIELTSYFNRSGSMQTREFLPHVGVPEVAVALDSRQRVLKQRMFDCFTTQQRVLRWIPIDSERFRRAPSYNFFEPPHSGKLYYELFDWGTTGERWRELARKAWHNLRLGKHSPAAAELPAPGMSG